MEQINLTTALEKEDKDAEFPDNEIPLDKESAVIVELYKKKVEKLDEEIKDLQQDRTQRKYLSYALFGFMCIYMLIAMVIVFCCGSKWMVLSDRVLIVLLTTTLADIIGIFSFVAKYLYHNK